MDIEWDEDKLIEEAPTVWESITPAQSHLNYWMRSADRDYAKSFGRILKEIGIIASEWAAMRVLYRPQRASPVELGVTLGMSKGGASKLVSRLVAKGLAVKETHVFDRRFRSVGLTRQGRELVVFLAAIEKSADREFFGSLGNNRRFRLREWMKRLFDTGCGRRMDQWVSAQLKQNTFERIDPQAQAKAAARAQADADAFWESCMRAGMAAAIEQFSSSVVPPSSDRSHLSTA